VNVRLNIMDGILAMDKQGPVTGHVYEAGKILMSEDSLALDAVAADMIGMRIEHLPFYTSAIKERIGEWDLGRIEVCGDYASPPRLAGFKIPRALMMGGGGGAMKFIVDLMKTRPQMDLKKCKNCNVCVDSCPVQAIDRKTKNIDYSKCIECMCCHELCVHKAVKLVHANRVMRMFSHFKKQD
jgi:Pyruvate/2-oxoacid:ferredoxin oxidoreductase delta subunit